MIKIALCQTGVVDNKDLNIECMEKNVAVAAQNGAHIVALSEMFNCPYSGDYFSKYAEEGTDDKTVMGLRKAAKENNIYIIGGSIPELFNGNIYNTSYVIDSMGEIIAKHRKIHLFDVNIKDGISFMESDYLKPGKDITVFNTPFCRVGLCICYDIRFPELLRSMVLMGAEVIFVPAVFNMTTGPIHWHTLFKARAIDNQVYMAGISPSRSCEGINIPYGHSLVVNPWGEVISEAKENDEIVYATLDMEFQKKIREQLPLLKHRKPELYINM